MLTAPGRRARLTPSDAPPPLDHIPLIWQRVTPLSGRRLRPPRPSTPRACSNRATRKIHYSRLMPAIGQAGALPAHTDHTESNRFSNQIKLASNLIPFKLEFDLIQSKSAGGRAASADGVAPGLRRQRPGPTPLSTLNPQPSTKNSKP